MPILTNVEKKSFKGRFFLTMVTLLLTLGGITMVYPFLLMFSGAMRSDMDSADMQVRPAFLRDDVQLVRKFLETKYNYNSQSMNIFRQGVDFNFRDAHVDLAYSAAAAADLETFMNQPGLPDHWQALGGTALVQSIACLNHELLIAELRSRFDDNLDAFIAEQGVPVPSWWTVHVPMGNPASVRPALPGGPLLESYLSLMRTLPAAERSLVNLSGWFLHNTVLPAFGLMNLDGLNEAWDLSLDSIQDLRLPSRVPKPPAFRAAWLEFVNESLHVSYIRSDATDGDYREFLRNRFSGIAELRRYWRDLEADSFEAIRLPADTEWIEASQAGLYREFLQALPPESLRLVGPEFAWRNFLRETYGTPEAAAAAHGITARDWDAFAPPIADLETAYVLGQTRTLRWRYATRNFRIVTRQMFVQGRPFVNTIIYVSMALILSLTLQPLGAYALSRFAPPGTWKMIFILVATMAFPPMVGLIPKFLVIQGLGLLNTYIALILPLMVNGMLIFLLKGFFDSIPKDLYEAAMIDGASEWRIFWQITMSMSKPILAVVALNTFSSAWMAFMYPLIVCPAEEMHVLAVWLQQFQLNAPGTAVFASIILASIPSLVIFMFAQRTIMRGIAVPSEK